MTGAPVGESSGQPPTAIDGSHTQSTSDRGAVRDYLRESGEISVYSLRVLALPPASALVALQHVRSRHVPNRVGLKIRVSAVRFRP